LLGERITRLQWWPGGHGGSVRLADAQLGRIQRVDVGRLLGRQRPPASWPGDIDEWTPATSNPDSQLFY
jgi:hypothetical protein